MTDKLVRVATVERGEAEQEEYVDPNAPALGRWYWVRVKWEKHFHPESFIRQGKRTLGCVTHVGSNYAKFDFPSAHEYGGGSCRVHFDNFDRDCEVLTNQYAQQALDEALVERRTEVQRLMGEVQRVTAALAIGNTAQLQSGGETQALARVGDHRPIGDYKKSLVKAKKELLPDLFKAIEAQNEGMVALMKGQLIPLEAQAGQLRPLIKKIDDRIFSVELYAGLCESVDKIRDGAPADPTTKIHLHQRRHYMDEECLVDYEAGGMEFADIGAFDAWMAKPEHADRLLPHARSVVAFRVRRNKKERDNPGDSLSEAIKLWREEEADALTFLYMRNGDQIYRLSTKIDFGEQLFPDVEHQQMIAGQTHAKMHGNSVDKIVNANQYADVVETEKRIDAENVATEARNEAAQKAYEAAVAVALAAGHKKPEHTWSNTWGLIDEHKAHNEEQERRQLHWPKEPARESTQHGHDRASDYVPYADTSVYYDDISEHVREEIERHNRLVLVIQGLLDRSPTMHPHPPWQLWTPEGFSAALELVYDESRALVAGAKPDFEAFRRRMNLALKPGAHVVGQTKFWMAAEAVKKNEAMAKLSYRERERMQFREYRFYKPRGDPGPGLVAAAARVTKKGCTFAWVKPGRTVERRVEGYRYRTEAVKLPDQKRSISVPLDQLLCVDDYQLGDFRQFFADPRTRAEYLVWAPMLLVAEDWKAGKIAVDKTAEEE